MFIIGEKFLYINQLIDHLDSDGEIDARYCTSAWEISDIHEGIITIEAHGYGGKYKREEAEIDFKDKYIPISVYNSFKIIYDKIIKNKKTNVS